MGSIPTPGTNHPRVGVQREPAAAAFSPFWAWERTIHECACADCRFSVVFGVTRGGGVRVAATERLSVFADMRVGIQGELDTIRLLLPVRGGVAWRF